MAIKDLFKDIPCDDAESEVEVEEVEDNEPKDDLTKLFESVYNDVNGVASKEVSTESILEDYSPDSDPEDGAEEHWEADVVLYPMTKEDSKWKQAFMELAGDCHISFSSSLALETIEMDEAQYEDLKNRISESVKVYALPSDEVGFQSRAALIEAQMDKPERVVVIDTDDEVDEDGNPVGRRAFIESVKSRGSVIVNTPEEAAEYASSYLP